jgi:hypothetical protein
MLLSEIVKTINAEVHTCGDEMDLMIDSACGADLMSDVMAFSRGFSLRRLSVRLR